MNPDLGTELRSGRIISSSLETPVQTDPDMAQSPANDSDNNEASDISSQLSEIKESYERKINELQNEFSQLKDLMMAVISKTDTENRQSTSKGPSKPTHTVGLDSCGKSYGHLDRIGKQDTSRIISCLELNKLTTAFILWTILTTKAYEEYHYQRACAIKESETD